MKHRTSALGALSLRFPRIPFGLGRVHELDDAPNRPSVANLVGEMRESSVSRTDVNFANRRAALLARALTVRVWSFSRDTERRKKCSPAEPRDSRRRSTRIACTTADFASERTRCCSRATRYLALAPAS